MNSDPRIAADGPEVLDGFPVEYREAALACGYLLLNEDVLSRDVLGTLAPEISAVAVEIAESISNQLLTSTSGGYRATMDNLNENRAEIIKFPVLSDESLLAEFQRWFNADIFQCAVAFKEEKPDLKFSLVATPNIEVNHLKLIRAVRTFGLEQSTPAESYIYEDFIYKLSANEIAGSLPGRHDPVIFSLIPNIVTSGMEGTSEELANKYAQLQEEFPSIKVPNLLDALTYWQTLRAQEIDLTGDEVFDRTNIFHFDIQAKYDNGTPSIPMSCISGDGTPELYDTGPSLPRPARISIG